ncbi:MAG: HD domain-containing protein [Candidatus Caldatribacterium sp.]|nr:HD domain-containing protein [Candidatus Caldatribacterium sp.]
MARVFEKDPFMLEHTKRVFEFVREIARETPLSEKEKRIAEIAAIFHDVGIEEAERKYGSREGC